ncbi:MULTISPECIES: hydroxymethylbilane synthase [Dehalobacter]|jgi:hydroxymethylbilane synthase|uniref:Porphobilinogen deaminase n=2 Tax=Dehalobacter restrictus TaxID=55583 RepID=A0A857DMG3_9FIRM|nr:MULTISPECIES: hydroxymethylbilane synthase [Dehalobacter]AHF11130.1 porphobilinogen deaminase [Dehalobacter restrictus DSM 9455]MCG1024610.1 hydroxymethylbilane synthase [Dehalobacter sp.]MDJ0305278.1 hydroxymethylbilane synthase [Dehalobacter sp.]OCZ53990.1 hydroxymethylbilane synthase [Dehalobacter sp. TeCB1]QHA01778.1 hydroxymethylbilane synthase [Dehalobacter restrictus]
MGKRKIIIGSRESRLAVIQSQIVMEQIRKNHPELELELITMKTTGDIILEQTLDKIGGKGLFVKELDRALCQGVIDIAVHSLKDMPAEIPEDLPITAFSKREDPRDVLVLPQGTGSIENLDKEKAVGCSSARRTIQFLDLYPGLDVKPVRGNVLTRLKKLDEGEFSSLLLAFAGLKRLSLENRISRVFSTEEMIPSAGQGILAIQGRKGEDLNFLACINDKDAQTAALAERAFIQKLDGGCSSPAAAFAEVHGTEVRITGLYVDVETGEKAKGSMTGDRRDAAGIGYRLATRLFAEVR